MATSAVRFLNHDVFVRDSDLGDWVQAMTVQSREWVDSGEDVEWMLEACNEWCDIYENLPPGLKDIELDETLRDDDRKRTFKSFLETTDKLKVSEGFDVDAAKGVSSKILRGLFADS